MKNNFIKQIESRSVVQQVIDSLTGAMISGDLVPGDKLPAEPQLAKDFGVGRSSIREAIKILEYMGVLESKRSEGTFISSGFKESLIDPMIYGIILGDRKDFSHLIEIRQMVEAGIIRLAIKNKDEIGIAKLNNVVAKMKEISFYKNKDLMFEKFMAEDEKFHNVVLELCKNPISAKIFKVVRTLTYSIRLETVKHMVYEEKASEFVKAHIELYNIINKSDMEELEQKIYKSYFMDDVNFDI